MLTNIREQPAVVARMAADVSSLRETVAAAGASGSRFVLFVVRGASHNAAMHGKYLAAIQAGLPAGLAIPSAATLHGAEMNLHDCLVVGISQSGRYARRH